MIKVIMKNIIIKILKNQNRKYRNTFDNKNNNNNGNF